MELIVITILGFEYKINCASDKVESLKKSAALLDSRLSAMRAENKMSIEQAAIMVGLNLSDELLLSESALKKMKTSWISQLDELNETMDDALKQKVK